MRVSIVLLVAVIGLLASCVSVDATTATLYTDSACSNIQPDSSSMFGDSCAVNQMGNYFLTKCLPNNQFEFKQFSSTDTTCSQTPTIDQSGATDTCVQVTGQTSLFVKVICSNSAFTNGISSLLIIALAFLANQFNKSL
jgi:hypothetical protein